MSDSDHYLAYYHDYTSCTSMNDSASNIDSVVYTVRAAAESWRRALSSVVDVCKRQSDQYLRVLVGPSSSYSLL